MTSCGSSTSNVTSVCLWVIGVAVLVSLIYMYCTTSSAPPRGSSCSAGGRSARRALVNHAHGQQQSGESTVESQTGMQRVSDGKMPGDALDESGDWLATAALQENQQSFPNRSDMLAGNKTGAITLSTFGSQSGRADGTGKSRTIGLNDRAWLTTIPRGVNSVCVSFNDSAQRQDMIMKLTNCDQTGTCPDGMPEHKSVTRNSGYSANMI
mgnify:CR=1 FL=1|tara:strand:- start:875 stop:1504 length:630 start_codon:yes stop_codon:yes gene_type:complete